MKQLAVEIIQRCPNRCLHCSSISGLDCTQKIETGKVREIIDSAANLGMEILSISGGEPFLHPGLAEIVRYAKDRGLTVYIYTCGIVLNNAGETAGIPAELLGGLCLTPADRLIFNLSAVDEAIYDRFTNTSGNQKFVFESIHRAQSAGILTELHFVPTKLNIGEIDSVLRYAEKEGIYQVSFLGLVPHGRAKENRRELFLSAGENQQLKDKLERIVSGKVRIGTPLQQENSGACCQAGMDKLYIRYDGKVLGCEAFKYIKLTDDAQQTIEPDSIHDSPLEEIVIHSRYLQLEKQFAARMLSGPGCGENCPVQRMIRSSDAPLSE